MTLLSPVSSEQRTETTREALQHFRSSAKTGEALHPSQGYPLTDGSPVTQPKATGANLDERSSLTVDY